MTTRPARAATNLAAHVSLSIPMALIQGTKNADVLIGTLGQTDQFYVNNAGDQIIGSEARDVVQSWIDFDLTGIAAQYLVLMGRSDLNATGNDAANVISGNAGDNIINGGRGQDRLTGGRGADSFVFDCHGQANADVIEDFSLAQGDQILLSGAAFGLSAGTVLGFSEGAAVGTGPQVVRDEAGQLWLHDAGRSVVFANCRSGLASSAFAVI